MNFMILLMLAGCAKQGLINKAKNHFVGTDDCISTLKKRMEREECTSFEAKSGIAATLIRCYKPDKNRGRFWDNYIFRISSAKARISQDQLKQIEKHTICIDRNVRIEAWPPRKQ